MQPNLALLYPSVLTYRQKENILTITDYLIGTKLLKDFRGG